jgi:hypothetical protein
MNTRWVMMSAAALLLAACVIEPAPIPGVVVSGNDPYYYSPTYCAGCWYGQWGDRIGYHRGGGRPWEREHVEWDHHQGAAGHDVKHNGHR